MIKLVAGQYVKLEAWKHEAVRFNTVRGYALENNAKYGEDWQTDPEEDHQRALQNGHQTAWTMKHASALYGDRAYGEMKRLERIERFENAILIHHGQVVEIENEYYEVKVMKRNEESPTNSDPIHFIKL